MEGNVACEIQRYRLPPSSTSPPSSSASYFAYAMNCCSTSVLHAYFDVDTSDFAHRAKSVFTTLTRNDGFLYGALYHRGGGATIDVDVVTSTSTTSADDGTSMPNSGDGNTISGDAMGRVGPDLYPVRPHLDNDDRRILIRNNVEHVTVYAPSRRSA